MELGTEAGVDEAIVNGFVCGKDGGAGFARHGLSVYGVAVIIIEKKQLGVAAA